MGQGGAVFIDTVAPNTSVNIDEYGQIFLNNEILDTLDVVSFENMERLEKNRGESVCLCRRDSR